MPLQAVYKFTEHSDDRRIFAGRIEAGKVSVGDKVVFSPSNKISTIKSIEAFNAAPRTSDRGRLVDGFTLTEEIYVTRGEVMSHVEKPPLVSTQLQTNIIWLGKKPFVAGRDYKLKLGTAAVPVRLGKINKVIDASAKGDSRLEKDHVGRHDVADVVLELKQPMAFDLTADCEATGRFVIVDELRRRGRRHHHRGGQGRPARPARRGAAARLQLGRGRRHRGRSHASAPATARRW